MVVLYGCRRAGRCAGVLESCWEWEVGMECIRECRLDCARVLPTYEELGGIRESVV